MTNINSLIINIFICTCAFVVVHGDDYSWIPATVPTLTEQCRKFKAKYRGHCDMGSCYESLPCQGLLCLRDRDDIIFRDVTVERARNGTHCGPSHVCRKGECLEVPKEKLPKEEGLSTKYRCGYVEICD